LSKGLGLLGVPAPAEGVTAAGAAAAGAVVWVLAVSVLGFLHDHCKILTTKIRIVKICFICFFDLTMCESYYLLVV
jgi:hypothetical protein